MKKKVTSRESVKRTTSKKESTVADQKILLTPFQGDIFALRPYDDPFLLAEPSVHRYGKLENILCSTDTKGFASPEGRSPLELVVDATDGFIPLWAEKMDLRWRFNAPSFQRFQNPEAAKRRVRDLFANAVLAWGAAAPINFKERHDAWDFEITVSPSESCSVSGCTLARAFFPDGGRHDLMIYPTMFSQTEEEQVETMIHEIGHIFGLRHFFAPVSETAWASEIFGTHHKFTIMNYGADSRLTQSDRDDLTSLYQMVWSGELTEINGTPIRTVRPFHLS